jgi:hypothetical protein
VASPFVILDMQPALLEQFDLCGDVDDGLMENSHALKAPGKKKPRNLCLAADATIGMAGVLRARLGTTASLCKFFAEGSIGGYARFCMSDLVAVIDGRLIFFR